MISGFQYKEQLLKNNRIFKMIEESFPQNIVEGSVVVLTCGGTIAGVGPKDSAIGYTSGALMGAELLELVPGASDIAPLLCLDICNKNSDDITSKDWEKLRAVIKELNLNPAITGFVITTGTDTLEELSFYLYLTLNITKPVVITGAMRPSTANEPDGPKNLLDAVAVASDPKGLSNGRGVMVVFNGRIYNPRFVTKTHTSSLSAIEVSNPHGVIGVVSLDGVVFTDVIPKGDELMGYFEPLFAGEDNIVKLPKVTVVYFETDAPKWLLKKAIEKSDGVVIAGAGAGEYSKKWMRIIEEYHNTTQDSERKPIMISSRVGAGNILDEQLLLPDYTISAGDLNPQKAAVFLRLLLAKKEREDNGHNI